MADDAGALLVRSGLVSASALEEARSRVADLGGTLGEQLVAQGVVTDDALTAFYQQRLLVPKVNPNTLARLPAKVVAVIPSDMAVELRAIPVSLDADNNLTVAMSDPSDRHAVDEIAFFTGTYVVRAVATQMQIAWCLAHYYGHVTHLGQRLLQPDGEPDPARPRTTSQPPPRPRAKGLTGKIEAARHRGIVPGQAMVGGASPRGDAPEESEQPSATDAAPVPVDGRPRSRTASGEIRVPGKRATSIKPPLPEDSGPMAPVDDALEPSGPVITIEADEGSNSEPVITIEAAPPSEDVTEQPLPVPRRKRPAEPDPPELAARAGEVQLATGVAIKAISFDEPSIMISEELERALRPTVSGELAVRDHKDSRPPPLPSISVELDGTESGAVVIHDQVVGERSEPVLLEQHSHTDRHPASDPPTDVTIVAAPLAEIGDEPSDVVVLDTRKQAKRGDRITQIGIGPVTATTRARLDSDGVPTDDLDDEPTDARPVADMDATRIDTFAAPPPDDYTATSDEHLAAPPSPYSDRDTSPLPAAPPPPSSATPPPSGQVMLDRVRPSSRTGDEDDDDDIRGKPTMVMSAIELDEIIPGRTTEVVPAHLHDQLEPPLESQRNYDPTDDGWGPPGTTIPPPLLGAIPGALDLQEGSGMIPLPDIDTAPLIVAPPSPPVHGSRPHTATEAALARALEEATARVLELIHTLDHTTDRDQVIAVMIAHLAESHHRAGFFVIRGGELSLFAITPRVPSMPAAALRLDRPSTLQDVVDTRLPYRGPMHDEASRVFLQATLGACPAELLLVPIAVRERVVGVLFGDHRMRHTFDDQLALAARAAGMALERILKARRG